MEIYKKEVNMLSSISKNLPNKVTGTNVVLDEHELQRIFKIKEALGRISDDLRRIS